MNFSLDPSSGFADSYLDVEFSINIPEHPKAIIRVYNEATDDQLQILGTSFGYILHGTDLILKGETATIGHINIFNHDKMNKKFLAYRSVTLKCVAEFYNSENEKTGEEEESVTFYNEIHSLDAEVIPFDLIIHNKSVQITENEALRIDVISDMPKRYELCISSLDDRARCHIEVSARAGKTTIEIPGEFLYHDLELRNNKDKKFKFLYVKHQGTTMSRMANKRYMSIQDSEIDFQISGGLTPSPQHRRDPVGRLIGKKFVISDRYLVMCPGKSSGFSRKSEFGKEKLMDLTMMINEGQHMHSLDRQIKQFKVDKDAENINKTTKSLQLMKQAKQKMRRPQIATTQIQLMQSVSRTYDAISSKRKLIQPPKAVQSFSAKKETKQSGGCAPCSRKKKNA